MGFKEECGIFCCYTKDNEAVLNCSFGIHSLQHRGQESYGVIALDNTKQIYGQHHRHGQISISDIIANRKMKGNIAMAHTRYSTSGCKSSQISFPQPKLVNLENESFGLAYNGNITNTYSLKKGLEAKGFKFQSNIDSEVICVLIQSINKISIIDRLIEAVKQLEGGFSIVIMGNDFIAGTRDKFGIRPLAFGRSDNGSFFGSETCALDTVKAKEIQHVKNGEILIANENGIIKQKNIFSHNIQKFCVFEKIYFSRPDSQYSNQSTYSYRKAIGAALYEQNKNITADMVVPVPDSGIPFAIGYGKASNIDLELGIIRSHNANRTFIEPTQKSRIEKIRLKHNVNHALLKGKSIVLIDDSIVRGNTSRKIIDMLREAGVREIHFRIGSPPIKHACCYGIDTPNSEELIAHNYSIEKIAKLLNVDSLEFISLENLCKALKAPQSSYCHSCFSGKYLY